MPDPKPIDLYDLGRRIYFVLASVERACGIDGRRFTFGARIENALAAAMHAPAKVEPWQYKLLYLLQPATPVVEMAPTAPHGGDGGSWAQNAAVGSSPSAATNFRVSDTGPGKPVGRAAQGVGPCPLSGGKADIKALCQ